MSWSVLAFILATLFALLLYLSHRAARVDWQRKGINWIDGLVRLLCKHFHHLDDSQQIPLPATGPAIVVANHVSGLDPFLLISACRRPLRFLIAREEYERPGLHWLFKASGCIPVDRAGRPEKALRQALRALEQGEVIALFPHGKIHLDSDPPLKIKGGVARLAIWSQAAIYPVRIAGVKGEGQVAFAPFMPGKVKLTMHQPLRCDVADMKLCLAEITEAISAGTANRT
jgi:1-acyl-sn-glycerol-3-phosphate acyltransferase